MLLFFEIKSLVRSDCNGLCIALGCLIIVLGVEPVVPAEVVLWFVAFREEFLCLFKHRNGLQTERVAVVHLLTW